MTGGPLMTARGVAESLGVSTETILRWSRRGTLPGIRLPSGALRYRADALDDWLAERATPMSGTTALGIPNEVEPLGDETQRLEKLRSGGATPNGTQP
jgi:excisionase family DNA binding protein